MNELSLEELTAQLQAAQEKKAVVRLSERNVVELVNKLKELGVIDAGLLHTANGKEYLTREQLRKEIMETLTQAGGRTSLSELCDTLNVDLSHCERESRALVEQSKGEILSMQEELITQDYLRAVVVEVKERLETTGVLRIGDLAIQYGLNHDLLLSVVSLHLGSLLKGELVNSILFTPAHMDRLKAQLRGALRGTTTPIALAALIKQIQLDDSGTSDIIQRLIRDLIHQDDIQGELRSNNQWIPTVHTKAQRSAVVALFHQNGWVSQNAVRRVASDENAFLQEQFSEHCVLDTVVVSSSFVENMDAEIEEHLEQASWCDICSLLPMEFGEEDGRQLLLKCDSLKRRSDLQSITDTCVMLTSFVKVLSECEQRVQEWSVQLAKESLIQSKQKGKVDEASAIQQAKPKDEDEEEDGPGGKGKKKNRGKGKAKGKQTGSSKVAGKPNKETATTTLCPGKESLADVLNQWFPQMEEVVHLAETLSEMLVSTAVDAYNLTIEEATKLTDKRRQELKEKALKHLEETLNKIWLFSKGIDSLQSELDEANVVLLKKHAVKTTGCDAVDWLLRYFQLQEPGGDEDVPDEMIPIPTNHRSAILERLPKDVSPMARAAVQSTKQDEPEALLEALDSGIESCSIRFPKRDKKAEKQKVLEFETIWKERLKIEDNPATVLAILLPVLIAKMRGILVSLPGRAMPSLIALLKPAMKDADYEILEAFHKAVVEDLKQKSTSDKTEESPPPPAQNVLVDLMRKAKDLIEEEQHSV